MPVMEPNTQEISLCDADIADLTQLARWVDDADTSWTISDLRLALQSHDNHVVIARCGELIAGFYYSVLVAGEETLRFIFVAPQHRRLGIARRLLQHLLQRAATGVYPVLLELRQSNAAALSLYQQSGFDIQGRRPAYYPARNGKPREDAFLMARLPS